MIGNLQLDGPNPQESRYEAEIRRLRSELAERDAATRWGHGKPGVGRLGMPSLKVEVAFFVG